MPVADRQVVLARLAALEERGTPQTSHAQLLASLG